MITLQDVSQPYEGLGEKPGFNLASNSVLHASMISITPRPHPCNRKGVDSSAFHQTKTPQLILV